MYICCIYLTRRLHVLVSTHERFPLLLIIFFSFSCYQKKKITFRKLYLKKFKKKELKTQWRAVDKEWPLILLYRMTCVTRSVHLLIVNPVDWMTDWLTDWRRDWLTDGRKDWLTNGRKDRLTEGRTGWWIEWLLKDVRAQKLPTHRFFLNFVCR